MIDLFQFDDETEAQTLKLVSQIERELIKKLDAHRYGIILFEPDGRTVAINQQWQRLYLLPFDQVKDYNMLNDTNLQGKHIWPAIKGAFNGVTGIVEANHFSPAEWGKHGRSRWTEGHCLPIMSTEKRRERLLGTVLILSDVTEIKQSIHEVERLRQMLSDMHTQQMDLVSRLGTHGPAKPVTSTSRPKTMTDTRQLIELSKEIPRREREVFELLAAGCSVKEAAHTLDLAVKSVYTYRARLMDRLKVNTAIELAIAWREIYESPQEV